MAILEKVDYNKRLINIKIDSIKCTDNMKISFVVKCKYTESRFGIATALTLMKRGDKLHNDNYISEEYFYIKNNTIYIRTYKSKYSGELGMGDIPVDSFTAEDVLFENWYIDEKIDI